MKLFIESIFDKDTDKLDDAKTKATQAANALEKQHGNRVAAKIFYFATKIDKLIIATGDTGKKAMILDSNILMVKEIPDIKLGDIPTKMARYQELVIPAVDFKEKKLVFTKVKDLNDEKSNNQLGTEFTLTEVPNNNKIIDFEGYKVEIIDEQPKFLKIKASDTIEAEVNFMVGAFGNLNSPKDYLKILINGDELELDIDIWEQSGKTPKNYAKVIKNDTKYYVDLETVKYYDKVLDGQTDTSNVSRVVKVTLRGYFYEPLSISILGKTDQAFTNEAFGYIQHSLELVDIKPFEVPVPYRDVATELGVDVQGHTVEIKKKETYKDGITMGGVFTMTTLGSNMYPLGIKIGDGDPYENKKPYEYLVFDKDKKQWAYDKNGNYTYIPNNILPIPELNKPFYAQFSLNYKSRTATIQIEDKKHSFEIKPSEFDRILFINDKSEGFATNLWYWIGDTSDLEGDTKQVNG